MEGFRFVKRKIRARDIEVHPTESALILHCEAEVTVHNYNGVGEPTEYNSEIIHRELHPVDKKIVVESLSGNSSIPALAQEIITQCKLILPSEIPLIEQLLFFLQKRQILSHINAQEPSQHREELQQQDAITKHLLLQKAADLHASHQEIDAYVERLYEDRATQLKSTAMLLQLARNERTLTKLVEDETVLQALARLLREESRRSIELTANIMAIFFCVSVYSDYHHLLFKHRLGDVTLKIIDFELRRTAQLQQDLKKTLKENRQKAAELDAKLKNTIKRQDQLLFFCVALLQNLAENRNVERKMKKRGIIPYLVKMYQRRKVDLLILATQFLTKLSIFEENKTEMVSGSIVPMMSRFIPTENQPLSRALMAVLHNLSFDQSARHQIIHTVLPGLFVLLEQPSCRRAVIQILYLLSVEDDNRAVFTYTEDAIPLLLKLVLEFPGHKVGLELMALLINLSCNLRFVEVIADHHAELFSALYTRALSSSDHLLLKFCRTCFEHNQDTLTGLLLNQLQDTMTLMKETRSDEIMYECVSIACTLTMKGVKLYRIVKAFDLVPFIAKNILQSSRDDDIVLQFVRLIALLARDPKCAALLAQGLVIPSLIDVFHDKEGDIEIVLHCLYTFRTLLLHPPTQERILGHPGLPSPPLPF